MAKQNEQFAGEKLGEIERCLKENGSYISTTQGISMRPMLKSGRDVVVVLPKTERLKKFDVALYKRGEVYVLHRVIKVEPDGYVIRGDNTYYDEIVPENCVIGVLSEFFNKKSTVKVTDEKYLKYVARNQKSYKIRKVKNDFITAVKGVAKKIIGRK